MDRCEAWRSSQGLCPRKIDFTWLGQRSCNEIIANARDAERCQFQFRAHSCLFICLTQLETHLA
ncbi:hypothetical protein T03_2275 [Trichinella britovi]|uniref:Uncharacterized protein n=1 Tax=Trichinella britovi TaxID=45882 RepID=A0A0V0YW81_TRIBR|nr:hypothetical protein T03_2275 [Trichinella britovi]